jgi:molybdopterin/thiamine biosynthesis adenylyltransferase
MLSNDEIKLYTRHLGIPSWGTAGQEKLKGSRVFVAGAGGLGSSVLYYLAAAGVGNLALCDYDVIDISNLNRQILHRFKRIGEPKVESARASLLELNPFINITAVNKKITLKNAEDLVAGSDLIIDCLDNFKTRHVLNRASVSLHIPLIHAGVSEFRGQLTFLHPPETPCLACLIPKAGTKRINYIAGPTPGVLGSLQAVEALKYLAGIGSTLKNRMLFWDGLTMEFETISLRRNPGCRVCNNM